MATIASVSSPVESFAINPVASALISGRFSIPPSALGFITEGESVLGLKLGLQTPYVIQGALDPESPYLEPTIGQIWPR